MFSLHFILSGAYYGKTILVLLISGGSLFAVWFVFRILKPDEVVKLRFMQTKSTFMGVKTLIHAKSSTGYKYFGVGAKKHTGLPIPETD